MPTKLAIFVIQFTTLPNQASRRTNHKIDLFLADQPYDLQERSDGTQEAHERLAQSYRFQEL